MARDALSLNFSDLRERFSADVWAFAEPLEENNDDRPAAVSPAAQAT